MIDFTQEQFNEIKTKGEALYKSLGEVYCPYFKEKVVFNSYGLEHLKFKNRNKTRSQNDQYMRFKLLVIAPEVIKLTHTLQGVKETQHFEKIRVHSRTDLVLKPVTYYEFVAIVKRVRVKVILKQIDNQERLFWSIIPFWRMNHKTMNKILHEGNPEND